MSTVGGKRRRFLYPLEGEVFETVRKIKLRGIWYRVVVPTPKYRWSEEDERLVKDVRGCMVLEYHWSDRALPRRCLEIDWDAFYAASKRIRQAVQRWLEALRREYEPTDIEVLGGRLWKHKKQNLYILPHYPDFLLFDLD